jgi:hypothetical protein
VKINRSTHGTAHLLADQGGGRHWAGQLVGQAAGHQAEKPGHPCVVTHEERPGAGQRRGEKPGGVDRHRRHLAPLVVDRLELLGHRLGALRIRFEQERHGQLRVGDPAGGVDSRHDSV